MNRPPPNYVTGTNCVVDDDHQYTVPMKMIKTQIDMPLWEKSEAYMEYLGFILSINQAVEGKSNSQGTKECSEAILRIDAMLDDIKKIIDDTPPIDQPQRFGNQAFRTFYDKLKNNLFNLLQKALPEGLYRAVPEIMIYLLESFGNSTRVDYGTGHEISFVMFLCCLFKIGFLNDQDKAPTGCKIFTKYLDLCRRLQQVYRMEPAGSHGVWSLDDYQFVPFIWGSSQLIGHPAIEPPSFLKKNIVDQHSNEFMFLACIRYINKVKTGPFSEHSNQLWNVSGVPSWNRVNGGLVKMYKAEVLAKFPVVQHIVFGTLLPLTAADPNAAVRKMKSTLALSPKEIDPLVFQPPKDTQGDVEESDESRKSSEDKFNGGCRYKIPKKMIKSSTDMPLWEKSEAYRNYLGFILLINQAVEGKSNSEGSRQCSEAILKLNDLLDDIEKIVDDTPPISQPQRFGNQAFRTFYLKLQQDLCQLLRTALPEELYRPIPEIKEYLLESFGNSTRIDYGTGHELSFVMFLYCLFRIGFLNDEDKAPTGCKIFTKYLGLCRKLQLVYRMEPAGSHGVWSLDDYQFVPFIWGSSQLIDHPSTIGPHAFLNPMIVDQYGDEFMFLSCIRYINRVKSGPFYEHSNRLWILSGTDSWIRMNQGLVTMYRAEVLGKFPVVQHIVFGSLLPLTEADPTDTPSTIPNNKSTEAIKGEKGLDCTKVQFKS